MEASDQFRREGPAVGERHHVLDVPLHTVGVGHDVARLVQDEAAAKIALLPSRCGRREEFLGRR